MKDPVAYPNCDPAKETAEGEPTSGDAGLFQAASWGMSSPMAAPPGRPFGEGPQLPRAAAGKSTAHAGTTKNRPARRSGPLPT